MKTILPIFKKTILCYVILMSVIFIESVEAETQNISLSSGWNFVAFQIEPEDTRIQHVLDGLDVISVWHYDVIRARNGIDPWLSYDPRNPLFLNDLYELHARRGYWIQMGAPGTLTISGKLPTASIPIYMESESLTSWNPIGFYSLQNNYTVRQLLSKYSDTEIGNMINSFWEYNSGNQSFESLNMNSILLPGRAYWLEVKQEFELMPDIEVTPTILNFGSQGSSGTLRLRSKSDGTIPWEAIVRTSDGNHWLGLKSSLESQAEPVQMLTGTAKFYYSPLYITIDRGGLLPGEYSGRILVFENPFPDFPLIVDVGISVESIQGDYSGTLVVHTVNGKSVPEISSTLFSSVHLDQLNVTMNIDPQKSLLFPHNTVLTGGLLSPNATALSVAGSLTLSADDDMNPYQHLGKTINRQFWMQTDAEMSGNDMLGGYYQEIVGGLIGDSIFVEGNFELRKISGQPTPISTAKYGTLQGVVLDEATQTPLGNVAVILSGGGINKMLYTTDEGEYSFYIYDSSYLLSFQSTGYDSKQIPIQFKHDDSPYLTIDLAPNDMGDPEGTIPGMQSPSFWVQWLGFTSDSVEGLVDSPNILAGTEQNFLTSLGLPMVGGKRVDGSYVGQSKQAGKTVWTGLTPKMMGYLTE